VDSFSVEIFSCDYIFNNVDNGIIILDRELTIRNMNKAAGHLLGRKPSEAIGRKCYDILQSTHCRKMCAVQTVLKEGTPRHMTPVLIKNKQGETIPVKMSTIPLKNDENVIFGALEIFSDQRKMYPTNYGKFLEIGLVSISQSMRNVFQLIEIVAATNSNVVIQGKTGTGKELVADAIHHLSSRRDKPFIKINCASLSDSLLESELFGHEKGAFTGALSTRIGKFEAAHTGTIFLDEIAEISPTFQAKLLRVVQEGELARVGSNEIIKIDVRIIAATNKDLYQQVEEGLFRDDLYYRLTVFPICLPPLRKRRCDIKPLVEYFINKFNLLFKKQKLNISEKALQLLNEYDFPGNVRELHNIIEHAFIKSQGTIIEISDLPPHLLEKTIPVPKKLQRIKKEKEIEYIKEMIKKCDGNKTQAAKELGISRKTLYNKLQGCPLKLDP
jgi:PAS domain S-box-containing protein